MKNKLKVVIGLLASGAVGAAIGMFFSPHKGTVLRRNIRRKGETIVQEIAENVEDRVGHMSDTITEKVDHARKDLKSKFNSVRDTFSKE